MRDCSVSWASCEPSAVLARAGALDDALDAWPSLASSPELRDRILAAAPAPRRALARWLAPLGLGAGLAAACAAGLVIGVQVSSAPEAPDAVAAAMASYDATADVAAWSDV